MPYINAEHLFKCETCKNHNKSGCAVWCDAGESYIPDMKKIPEADVVENYIPLDVQEALKQRAVEIAKAEVAREIFEEIDRLIYKILNDEHYVAGDMCLDVAELKKKYTEAEEK